MNLKTEARLLKLKQILNRISDISYAFSKINKQHPIDSLSEEEALEVSLVYEDLIADLENLIRDFSV